VPTADRIGSGARRATCVVAEGTVMVDGENGEGGDDGIRYDGVGDEVDADGGMLREDGAATRGASGAAFNPAPYMRQLRGRGGAQEYLDVKWRILWLRREHPDAQIVTEHVQIDEKSAVFKATVTLPSGGKATGYGSETAGDFGDFIEKAETKAIGRALNALGYGAQFAEGEETPTPPAEPPVRPTDARPGVAGQRATASPSAIASTPPPVATAPPRPVAPAAPPVEQGTVPRSSGNPPIDFPTKTERATGSPTTPAGSPAGATAGRGLRSVSKPDPGPTTEPALEDYSFTAFWRWARELGYQNKDAIEALIGRPMTSLSPAELRTLVRLARGET
jgi:hypothetical protein